MDGIRVPAHLQDTAREIGVMTWLTRREFPRQQWFGYITEFREKLVNFSGSETVGNNSLVAMIAIVIDIEESLLKHVLHLGVAIADELMWSKMCTAAAWLILVEYSQETRKIGVA